MIPGLLDSQIKSFTDRELAKILAEKIHWPTVRFNSRDYCWQRAELETQLADIINSIRAGEATFPERKSS